MCEIECVISRIHRDGPIRGCKVDLRADDIPIHMGYEVNVDQDGSTILIKDFYKLAHIDISKMN